MAQLSEFFAPYLNRGHSAQGLTIVAGDEPADRFLFWNNHHSYERSSFGGITGLRVPTDRLADADFLARIRRVMARRGALDYQGRTDSVTLRSTSLDKDVLDEAAEKLRKAGDYLTVSVVKDEDHAACVPRFRNPESVGNIWLIVLRSRTLRKDAPCDASTSLLTSGLVKPVPSVVNVTSFSPHHTAKVQSHSRQPVHFLRCFHFDRS